MYFLERIGDGSLKKGNRPPLVMEITYHIFTEMIKNFFKNYIFINHKFLLRE